MQRRSFLSLCAACAASAALGASTRARIALQPYETAEPKKETLDFTIKAIQAFYDVDVDVLAPIALPSFAWYGPNKRWRAEKLLDQLRVLRPEGALAIAGVLTADISTTKGKVHDWGIMGLGYIAGSTCVASTFRCGKGKTTKEQAQKRYAKVVVHELGHALGSDHCSVAGCLMNDAKGLAKTVDNERDFCGVTRMLFAGRKVPLVEKPVVPW